MNDDSAEVDIPFKRRQRIRRAMVTLFIDFNTDRMVAEYTLRYYLGDGK